MTIFPNFVWIFAEVLLSCLPASLGRDRICISVFCRCDQLADRLCGVWSNYEYLLPEDDCLIIFQHIETVLLLSCWESLVDRVLHSINESLLTEESVPNDEHSSVVLVNAVPVPTVVHTMVTRRVQDPLQRPQLLHNLRTNRKWYHVLYIINARC